MNINDYEVTKEEMNVKCKLESIFEHQKILLNRYHEIEKKHGLLLDDQIPVKINSHLGQARLKDLAWRVVEEITEATELLERDAKTNDVLNCTDILHFREELIDALHFYVELCIASDIAIKDLELTGIKDEDKLDIIFKAIEHTNRGYGIDSFQKVASVAYWVVEEIGKAMTCLKNKPWKKTQMVTDENKYRNFIANGFKYLIGLISVAGLSSEDTYIYYIKKNKVNIFRQDTNY